MYQTSWTKSLFVGGLSIVFLVFFWLVYGKTSLNTLVLFEDIWVSLLLLLFLSLWLILFLSCFTIFVLGVEEWWVLYITAFLLSLTLLVGMPSLGWFLPIAIGLLFAGSVAFAISLKYTAELLIRFAPFQVLPMALGSFFFFFSLLFGVQAYVQSNAIDQDELLDQVTLAMAGLIAKQTLGRTITIDEETTVTDFSEAIAAKIRSGVNVDDLNNPLLTSDQLETYATKTEKTIASQIESDTLTAFGHRGEDGQDILIRELLAESLRKGLQAIPFFATLLSMLPFILGFGVFIIIRGVSFLWRYGTMAVASGLYRLFVSLHLVTITRQQIPIERLRFIQEQP